MTRQSSSRQETRWPNGLAQSIGLRQGRLDWRFPGAGFAHHCFTLECWPDWLNVMCCVTSMSSLVYLEDQFWVLITISSCATYSRARKMTKSPNKITWTWSNDWRKILSRVFRTICEPKRFSVCVETSWPPLVVTIRLPTISDSFTKTSYIDVLTMAEIADLDT